MGWLQKHKDLKAEHQYEDNLKTWQDQIDNLNSCLALAKSFNGEESEEIMLKSGETLFFKVSSASLIGQKRGPGHYQGGSSGVSIPIGHIGHSAIRYRVGASRGTYMQGAPYDAPIDKGSVFITNQRIIFEGTKQTRECRYDKLLGVTNNTDGSTTFSVSNRQTPTTIHYGNELDAAFSFRLSLALAHYRNDVPSLINQLEDTLAKTENNKPQQPTFTTAT